MHATIYHTCDKLETVGFQATAIIVCSHNHITHGAAAPIIVLCLASEMLSKFGENGCRPSKGIGKGHE